MKITIELSDAQVKGIKKYLKEVGDVERPTKKDIENEIRNMVSGNLQMAGRDALSDYVLAEERKANVYN